MLCVLTEPYCCLKAYTGVHRMVLTGILWSLRVSSPRRVQKLTCDKCLAVTCCRSARRAKYCRRTAADAQHLHCFITNLSFRLTVSSHLQPSRLRYSGICSVTARTSRLERTRLHKLCCPLHACACAGERMQTKIAQ